MITWLVIGIVLVALGIIAALLMGKTLLLTSGVDNVQTENYRGAYDAVNKVKSRIENPNRFSP